MIISSIDDANFSATFGIDMASIGAFGTSLPVSAAWGRLVPGTQSEPHLHDETEAFIVIAGAGQVSNDTAKYCVGPGTVMIFAPFERHVIENTGDKELLFVDLYWRDAKRAADAADLAVAGCDDDRPVFVFSTPPTPNGDLHLGHLSGPYLGADVFVRFQRMNGVLAWHITGSDDFQSYVVACAQKEKRTPAETAAHYSAEIRATLDLMDISVDQYTVTGTDQTYPEKLRTFFSHLVQSGGVKRQFDTALFDSETGGYLYEADVHGRCPTCGAQAGGNICEECGEPNTCVDLIEPRSTRSAAPPRSATTDRFSVSLHDYRDVVVRHHRCGRVPAILRELAHRVFLREKLDIALTHSASWGVPPEQETEGQQVIWTWPEMAYGFLHGIELLGRRLGHSWSAMAPSQDWKLVHFFGYDNSFYHTILYPVLYHLAYPHWTPDIAYLPNEFYLLEGAKFSTSRRHAIWGKDILNRATVDAVRYYLSRTRGEIGRTNFDRVEYETVVKDRLIGTWQAWLRDLGSRIDHYYDGRAPNAGVWTPEHKTWLAVLGGRLNAVRLALAGDGFSLNRAVRELDGLIDDAVRLARSDMPVAAIETQRDVHRTTIALELAAARLLCACASPIMPRFAAALAMALGDGTPSKWPDQVTLIEPGTRIALTTATFFMATHANADTPFPQQNEKIP